MLLYNVTVGVDKSVEQEWLAWIKRTYNPSIMQTGMFVTSKIYKVLHEDDEGSISYSLQYFAETIEHIVRFIEEFQPELIKQHNVKFKDRHVAFRTLLEEV